MLGLCQTIGARKEIGYVLSLCDVGVGDFYGNRGHLWGGTAWEVLAAGKPLLQRVNFSVEEFEGSYGHAPPPLLDASSPEVVSDRLREMAADENERKRIGDLKKLRDRVRLLPLLP